ncbi:MAG: anthranilate synthase component I [Candidatus Nitrohelix vancouverensis]|uniref:Anthranilate synthase component 1 n=1 Tax=Candidatus Nitrohelix vancouverensis TaxID=2705534 RepID=A0A7T0C356_9BACT|nr:MAG: anthranilate synthase component I [Candidatus Nitrohelix vancouverensis]
MIVTTFEQFKEKTKQGNLVPVCKEIFADLNTPVSAYLKMGGGDYSFLLESVEGGEKWARYSFIGFDPALIVNTRGKKITFFTDEGEESRDISEKNPLKELKTILQKYKPVEDPDLPRFYGGAVGFMSYDIVRYFEDLPDNTLDDLNVPESEFMITNHLLIFDNMRQTIKIVANVFVDTDDLDGLYQRTLRKITDVEKALHGSYEIPRQGDGVGIEGTDKVESNFSEEGFKKAVLTAKDYIKEGDVIQVVLSQRLKFPLTADPFNVYRALRTVNPSPYMYYLKFGERQIVGSSPEILVRLEDTKVEVRPIAGTRKRGASVEEDLALEKDLLQDEKEIAEHIMLVDLGRNDIGRVAQIGTVDVNEKFLIERYSHVMHIVSNVRSVLKEGLDCYDVIEATFPAGTVSGAPKIRAMEIIDELEPTRRGVYAGAIGYIGFSGSMDTAIAIRTLLVENGVGYLGVGAGIVNDSVPENEYEETMNKGKALLKAVDLAEKGWIE